MIALPPLLGGQAESWPALVEHVPFVGSHDDPSV